MSIRTERVAKLLQRDLAELLSADFGDQLQPMVTVTGVRMTKDLGIAYVYVSVMGASPQQRQVAFRRLQELNPAIRAELAARIRHQVRSIPELKFFLDESLEKAQHMESLFDKIRQERALREGAEPEAPAEPGAPGATAEEDDR